MALTWREVAAPNFQGVTQAMALSGRALEGVGAHAQDVVAALRENYKLQMQAEDQQNQANFQKNLDAFSTPEGLAAARQSGALFQGVNVNTLSPEALKMPQGRIDDMLRNAASEANIRSADAATVGTNQRNEITAQSMADDAAARSIIDTWEKAGRPYDAESRKALEAFTGGNSKATEALRLAVANRQAEKISEDIINLTAKYSDKEELGTKLREYQRLAIDSGDPERIAAVRQVLEKAAPAAVQSVASPLTPTDKKSSVLPIDLSDDQIFTESLNYQDGHYAKDVPLAGDTIGDHLARKAEWQKAIIAGKGKVGSTSDGKWQMTQQFMEEFGPKAFPNNPDWTKQKRTNATDYAIASAGIDHVLANPKEDIRSRWLGLKNLKDPEGKLADKAFLQGMPRNELLEVIALTESGGATPGMTLDQAREKARSNIAKQENTSAANRSYDQSQAVLGMASNALTKVREIQNKFDHKSVGEPKSNGRLDIADFISGGTSLNPRQTGKIFEDWRNKEAYKSVPDKVLAQFIRLNITPRTSITGNAIGAVFGSGNGEYTPAGQSLVQGLEYYKKHGELDIAAQKANDARMLDEIKRAEANWDAKLTTLQEYRTKKANGEQFTSKDPAAAISEAEAAASIAKQKYNLLVHEFSKYASSEGKPYDATEPKQNAAAVKEQSNSKAVNTALERAADNRLNNPSELAALREEIRKRALEREELSKKKYTFTGRGGPRPTS